MERREKEEKRYSWKDIFGWLVIGAGCVGAGVGIYSFIQHRKLVKLFNQAASNVSELTTVDIQDAIVEQAVRGAANREVGRVVSRAVKTAEGEIASNAQKKVASAVGDAYKKISASVSDQIAKETAKISYDRLSEEAIDKAKEMLTAKFDSKLDELTEAYSKQIKSVSKVYESFADKLSGEKGKSISLNL